ncbi:DUF6896 domain-containing protein [Pedobacter metabolipauper]|uniref:SMI1/KNR4 family protein SUKH-1 n=1 Tax=Pedobacter metabolipauper TaxID=425513 RepID=A0A4R6SY92_9SPHI|nr:SMI1/KNR4 family protein [Pedobacter metabolipauper]TDQ11017.1 SMI1/KNR4 family protein SUKH-1 [Pedobacter metabolipauper]
MNLTELISAIEQKHKNDGIEVNPPASQQQIDDFQRKIGFPLPHDFIEFYKICNGFYCNEDIFNMKSIEDMLEDPDDYVHSWFYFSDYMINSDLWLLRLNSDGHYEIFNVSDIEIVLTSSLNEFLEHFLQGNVFDKGGLYDWQEKLKTSLKLKDISHRENITLIDIIREYQSLADKAVQIFKKKYKVDNILEAWHSRVYERTGKLIEEGLYFYAFHGIGLKAHFKHKIVDFDFAWFPEPRHDGFDLWRLTSFIENQPNKYPDYQDKRKVEKEFTQLVNEGIIAKPILDQSTTLYFFKNTLDESQAIDEAIRSNLNSYNSQYRERNWFQKLFGIK